MKLFRCLPASLAFFLGALGPAISSVQAAETSVESTNPTFGPYEAIAFDKAYLQNVKVVGPDVFIMLQPDHRNDQLTMKISMQKGAPYRKWFTGNEVLEAQENAGRAANTWTDRIQTSATYIEYYAGGVLFLHLKKVK